MKQPMEVVSNLILLCHFYIFYKFFMQCHTMSCLFHLIKKQKTVTDQFLPFDKDLVFLIRVRDQVSE